MRAMVVIISGRAAHCHHRGNFLMPLPAVIAAAKLLGFLLLVLLLAPPHLIMRWLSGPRHVLPQVFHRLLLKLFGIRVKCVGAGPRNGAILVSNHLSYLDIPVISSCVNRSIFVAKKDVADWPLFGWLARLQDTLFVDRQPSSARQTLLALKADWPVAANVVVFPEGTSSNGAAVLPFKSSLFALFAGRSDQLIQPVSLRLTEADGVLVEPQGGVTITGLSGQQLAARNYYTWHGDMALLPHLWAFAKGKGAVIQIIFHPCVRACDYPDRKVLAQHCFDCVTGGLGGAQATKASS